MPHPHPGRLVEVFGTSEGSGYLIGPGLILTAWHVVRPKTGKRAKPRLSVRILREYFVAPPKSRLKTKPVWRIWPGNDPGKDLDFALLAVDGPTDFEDDPVFWVELPVLDSTKVVALGFPDSAIFKNRDLEQVGYVPFDERDTRAVSGMVEAGTDLKTRDVYGRGTFDIVLRAEDEPSGSAFNWAGMSGAAVFEGPNLIGIVQDAAEAGSLHRLKALPVERLFRRTDVVEAIRKADRAVPPRRIRSTPYDVVGTEAFAASCRTFDTVAAKPFYGRGKDIDALNGALVGHDRGVILVRGETGLGKSRLAMQWADLVQRG
jgi:hypothetical protein